MRTLQFKCTLLSDIIINQKAATEGPNKTLDYIPGSNFLGIVASKLYKELSSEESLLLFHSGKVCFGDAHPANGESRSLRAPASMFNPKLDDSICYVHHCIPTDDETKKIMREKQLKQQRNGFYDFSVSPVKKIDADTSFAIKSAYDTVSRRSEDEKMYGYESLRKGLIMYFSIMFDDVKSELVDRVKESLTSEEGKHRVGRSRSAQYGLIKIEPCSYKEETSTADKISIGDKEYVVVYADSRLIFLDEATGMPTFQPTSKQLGLDGGEIRWDMSQIRVFQYSPWNYTRKCFDSDRCGIEKGSVIVVEFKGESPSATSYVGSYRNEGFGRVIYNPQFLSADSMGIAKHGIIKTEKKTNNKKPTKTDYLLSKGGLLKFLGKQYEAEQEEKEIYKKVNKWIGDNKHSFKGQQFASQWGTIRSLAMQHKEWNVLKDKLYGNEEAYLCHGVAADKWKERKRLEVFKSFCEDDDITNKRMAIINLAAEMAKVIRREED